MSSDERRHLNAVEECRKLTSFVSTSGASLGSDYQRRLSKSDTWSRYPGYHRGGGGAEGGATECGGRRKMSASAVLALIREQSTSRDDSENSSSQRGAVQRELSPSACRYVPLYAMRWSTTTFRCPSAVCFCLFHCYISETKQDRLTVTLESTTRKPASLILLSHSDSVPVHR